MSAPAVRVLFVCAGNTCRSPMAEALLRQRVVQLGLQQRVHVASAGVAAQPNAPVNPAAIRTLAAHGIQHRGQARRLEQADLHAYNLILPMDRATLNAIHEQFEIPDETLLRLLMAFAPDASVQDVFDPYGTDRYEEAFGLIEKGVTGLLDTI